MATKAQKNRVSIQFQPLVEELRQNLPPIPTPQVYNQCIDIFSKWHGNYFYLIQKFKTGEGGITEFFEVGLARLEFCGENQFNLSYFRHTGKWCPLFMYEDISLEVAKEAILTEPMFSI